MRHIQVLALIFAVTLASMAGCNSNEEALEQPNIIVILTDDHGFADLRVQGQYEDLKTPHLDKLAETGVRLTAGYVSAPQCIPSRAGLLSGKYQQRFGLDHNGTIPFPLEEVMIARRMKDAGYVTGMTGKWHLDPNRNQHAWIDENMPEIAGREKYVDSDIPHEKKIPYLPTEKGFDYVMEGHVNTYWSNYTLEGERIEKQLMHVDGYRLDIQSQAAVTFIDMNHDKPFFYYLSYFAPHVPLEATEKYLSRFPGEMPERRRVCLAMLAAIDDGVGSIKETLRKYDIEENTLIVFLGDNGAPLKLHKEDIPLSFKGGAWNGSLNEPYIGEKGMLSEAGTRVPFIMNWPGGLPGGMVYDRPVISMDIAATSLALAGKEVPGELDGVNVIPYINGALEGDPHEALYWRFWRQSAIRMGDWKYLRYKEGEFLFNVANDVHENVNLISEHPEKAMELKEKLIKWTDELKYPGLEMEGSPQLTKSYDFYF